MTNIRIQFLLLLFLVIMVSCSSPFEENIPPVLYNWISIMDSDGGNVNFLLKGDASYVNFLPKSNKIVISGGDFPGIWIMNEDGSDLEQLISQSNSKHISFSSDGKYMIFSDSDFFQYDFIKNDKHKILETHPVDSIYYYFPQISQNVNLLSFVKETILGDKAIYEIISSDFFAFNENIIYQLKADYSLRVMFPTLINEDKVVFYDTKEYKIIYYNQLNDFSRQIGEISNYEYASSDESAKLIAIRTRGGTNLYDTHSDELTFLDFNAENVSINKAGTHLISDGVKIYDLTSNEITELVTGRMPKFSSDGTKIVFIGQK